MIGMSDRRGRKRKIVNSPLRLFNESPVRKALRSGLDDQTTKLKPTKNQKSLPAELDVSSDEVVSRIATKSFYHQDAGHKYLTPLERKTQKDLLESITSKLTDQFPQDKTVPAAKPTKTNVKVKRVKKEKRLGRSQSSNKHQKQLIPTNEKKNEKPEQKQNKDNVLEKITETKPRTIRQSPRKDSNQMQNNESQNKSSPRKTPQKEHVYHKGTPKSKLHTKSVVKSTGKSAQKGIHMYMLSLDKGKKQKQGKAAKELEKVMRETKKKGSSQMSYVKKSSGFEDIKIDGIEPLDSYTNKVQSPKEVKNISPQKSPRRSPRKSVRNFDSPDQNKKQSENRVTETPESLPNRPQSPTDAISDATPKKLPVKLFPVFTPPTSPNNGSSTHSSPATSTPKLRKKSSRHLIPKLKDKRGLEQMTLDAGQKKFGALKCQTCGMVYTAGHPEDEADHAQFHKKFLTFIKFPGWKCEHVLDVFDDGRIIQITNKDPKYCKKKVEEVRELVDHELGFPDSNSSVRSSSKTLLFISMENKVAGCLIAEEVKEGYRVIPDSTQEDPVKSTADPDNLVTPDPDELSDEKQRAWCCSNVAEPVVCGVSRIWASSSMRRRNIASRMVDCLRLNYVYGTTLSKNDIAFSDPTPDGKVFASSYCGTKSFLVYKYR